MSRQLSHLGVVRNVSQGCATIEVSVPCAGCSHSGCAARRSAGQIQLAGSGLQPGDRVRLSLPASRITGLSLRLFGPPLALLVLAALMTSLFPGNLPGSNGLGPVLFGCAMVGVLLLGSRLGRQIEQATAETLRMDRHPGRTDAGQSASELVAGSDENGSFR